MRDLKPVSFGKDFDSCIDIMVQTNTGKNKPTK